MSINNTVVLFLFVTFFPMITFVVFPVIPEQGEIIIQSPGEEQHQQYYIKIRP